MVVATFAKMLSKTYNKPCNRGSAYRLDTENFAINDAQREAIGLN
jgi:hypothetical protein